MSKGNSAEQFNQGLAEFLMPRQHHFMRLNLWPSVLQSAGFTELERPQTGL